MNKHNINIPSGVVQFLEPLSSLRRKIENALIGFFTSKGYSEVVTSLFSYENSIFDELFEPLKTKLFKVIDKNSGQTMVLRADITMQITQAIIVGNLTMPVRVCYADNIYRDVEEHSGKKREFKQIGIELFGVKDIKADFEVVDIAIASLKKIGVSDICLRLSDTSILEAVLRNYSVEDKNTLLDIKELLYKKNIDLIIKRLNNAPEGFLNTLRALNKESGIFYEDNQSKLSQLYASDIIKLAGRIKKKHKDICIFLDLFYCEYPLYHHGIVFDIFSKNTSLVVGGRYGNVTKQFGKYIPATGFAINLDELTYFLFDKETK